MLEDRMVYHAKAQVIQEYLASRKLKKRKKKKKQESIPYTEARGEWKRLAKFMRTVR